MRSAVFQGLPDAPVLLAAGRTALTVGKVNDVSSALVPTVAEGVIMAVRDPRTCSAGGRHVYQMIVVKAFHDQPSNTCYKCGNSVDRAAIDRARKLDKVR